MKFGEFEIEPDAGVLRRNGVRTKLQDLPFRLLVVLMRRAGTVITREELRAELWGADTFVDAEAGLNTAIAKLREALGDSVDVPRFIETLPKRGYRFVGTIDETADVGRPLSAAETPAGRPIDAGRTFRVRSPIAALLVVTAAIITAVFAYRALAGPDRITIAVVRFHNETGDPARDRLAGTLTDAVVVALAANRDYAVIGNSPLLRTDRIFQDVEKIGDALRAQFVVLGQLQIADGQPIVRAHFIRVSDQTHLWATKIPLVEPLERTVTEGVTAGVQLGLERSPKAPLKTK